MTVKRWTLPDPDEPQGATMTLDELQADFPYGSHWRRGGRHADVVGWIWNRRSYGVVLDDEDSELFSRSPDEMRSAWERVPDPAPCPITEPVTLWPYDASGTAMWSTNGPFGRDGGKPAITLAPDGNGGIRATWKGGPR
jgi:hypothetical protein